MAAEPNTAAAGCGCMMLVIPVMMAAIPLTVISFWVWMIIHCCKYQVKDRNTWMLITILAGPLGGIIYFFVKDKKPNTVIQKEIKDIK